MIGNMSILDRIKLNNGSEPMQNYFHDLLLQDFKKAVTLINDENLHFPSLFILRSEIKKFNLASHLNPRNKNAFRLVNQILAKNKLNFNTLSGEEKQNIHTLLKWMIETGVADDGLNSQYDEILDAIVILLIKVFDDKSILNITVDMIFNRNKRKSFHHDLIWALFESRDPKFLFLIANRLFSCHWCDIELARKLLIFIPEIESNYHPNNLLQYHYANKWLQENHLFLSFTGEHFQQCCNPKPYTVSLDAKYLCKPLINSKERAIGDLSEKEKSLVETFRNLSNTHKIILSKYSFFIYRQNRDWWNIWINYPIAEQISYAKSAGG